MILAEPQTPLGELTVLLQTLYLDLSGPTSEENEGTYRGGEEVVEGREVRERGEGKLNPPKGFCLASSMQKDRLTS